MKFVAMLIKSTSLALLLGAAAVQGALPPKYQRQREFQAILSSNEIVAAFPDSEIIEQVTRLGADTYQVRSGRCSMVVRIVNDPQAPSMPGPRRFLVKPGKVTCQDSAK